MRTTVLGGRERWGQRLVDYPPERAERYRRSGAWTDTPLAQRLHEIAARFPERPAVVTAAASVTYAELDRATDRIAVGLDALGLRPGDPVLFQATNRLETVYAWYGCLKAGLVPVATLAAHRAHEIGHISRKVGAVAHLVETGLSFDLVAFARDQAQGHPTLRHILTVGDPAGAVAIESLGAGIPPEQARAHVERVQAGIDPLDVVAFQLSGGTTGVPKVIPRRHVEYWNNALYYARRLGWTEHTRVAHLIPLIHNAGITCALHGAHSVGACLVLATPDTATAFPLLARARATDVLIGHGHYQAVLSPGFDAARVHLRRVVLSGAKLTDELFARADDGAGHWAGQLFGMSEGLFTVTPPDAPALARATTVGTPIAPDDEVRILEPGADTELPDGTVGELCCRGPYTIPGYFDAPEHNRSAFTPDGFYRTGDLARIVVIDGVRYVSIEGRIKDLINRGGEKINAEEVELLLVRHPNVANAAVVAMPDPRLGEKTCAYLVAATGVASSLDDIRAHLEALGVAKFKWPERLEWVQELPQTSVGKVDKKRLRTDIGEKLASESARPGNQEHS
ncbi:MULTISPECIES: (2,3-dihydroxybenzoyl)adenylate synthase [Nocardia]|uniref:Putative acyl-CoA synthetase n=1 Tax=Nocardia farcinica (strain IFM 10152) TaxID=247156 RepID=Q5YXP8_NOCFA|nr:MULTISPECIES: AMP-binding protein [Nocardia]MBF6140184.1 AMP-binding protein [Nocardia farcinica]MBF6184734.1 AMP-binding protein [Nocardia farcinica]MBF6231163.1 AMP-binding protein [Nocardia farcinica]MBF6310578.1 AMP-binding protein [Nocardia farcinica]MBF6359592.1 AMP-binding protein [Nocardia farcinica]